jgi:hypothetical protein
MIGFDGSNRKDEDVVSDDMKTGRAECLLPITRRHVLGRAAAFVTVAGAMPLAGCGNTSEVQGVGKIVLQATGLGPAKQYTVADVERVHFASIGVRFGSNPEAMVVLGAIEPDRRLIWISAEHRVFITRGGRVMRFIGLDYDIVIEMDSHTDPLFSGLAGRRGPIATQWTLSYPERNIFGLNAVATLRPTGPDKFRGLYKEIPVTRWVETVKIVEAGWSFENEYWVAEDGQIWKSRQYLAPDLPPLWIEMLRPALET